MSLNEQQPHHKRQKLCQTRPSYRQGKKLLAVKVYTISQESNCILVHGVPAINVAPELYSRFSAFGKIVSREQLTTYPCPKFTEVHLIKYESVRCAQVAKRRMDDRSFFGSALHVCYAPEKETEEETRAKLDHRRGAVRRQVARLTAERERAKRRNNESADDGGPEPVASPAPHQYPRTDLDIGPGSSHTGAAEQQRPWTHRDTAPESSGTAAISDEGDAKPPVVPAHPQAQLPQSKPSMDLPIYWSRQYKHS